VANIFVAASATWNGKALKKAKQDVNVFDKQVKKLGGTLAAAFSVRAITRFGKEAVKAFAADEKAAKSLEVQLQNTGFAFAAPGVEAYISSLQSLYGVLDDELRPAFQQLLTATGSITKSQDALQTALNVSAATGRSLSEVSAALTRGFSGNTAGLSRLGAGISKATLKTGNMDKIMEELNSKFAGQAAARLDTYAGKMSLLQVAAADATEIIGKGLVDALTALSSDQSIESLSDDMTNLAKGIADVVGGIGELAKAIKTVGNAPGIKQLLDVLTATNIFSLTSKLGSLDKQPGQLPFNQQRSAGRISAKQLQTEDRLAKAKAAELATLQKKNAIENKNVEELKKKFDLERIGINAALNNATDEETKLRLKSQLAILDNNEALAKKYLAELEASEALRKLAEQAKLAGMSLQDFALFKVKTLNTKIDDYLQNTALEMVRALNAQIAAFIASMGGVKTPTSTAAPTYSYALSTAQATNEKIAAFQKDVAIESTRELNSRINEFLSQNNAQRSSSQTPMDIRLTVDAGGDRLSQAIAESIQVATRSGYSTVPNGFIV
jgi:hypothetical protein